uniref:Uncharacterized protein n=1 Tax=Ditylenchus dipsaci TaxID=166011 RepID=A0A915D3X9_9BILA
MTLAVEPDIVQDRAIDFHRKAAAAIKLIKETGSKDKKAAKASSKAAKGALPKRAKNRSNQKLLTTRKPKRVWKRRKSGEKEPLEEKFQELSTETGQKIVLLNQTHEDSTNEKAVRVPAVRAHDDASEVPLTTKSWRLNQVKPSYLL